MEVIGRVESGTETESNAGAIAEDVYREVNGRTAEETKSSRNRPIDKGSLTICLYLYIIKLVLPKCYEYCPCSPSYHRACRAIASS